MNRLGIDQAKAEEISGRLNKLLADYQMFYMNVRGFHWNIKGDKFFELHVKFEELYNDLQLKIDEIAERIRTLGATPMHSFTDYLANSHIAEQRNVSDGIGCINSIVGSLEHVIGHQRQLLDLSDEVSDEGTNALMSDYIREQEKLVWMYEAFLGK